MRVYKVIAVVLSFLLVAGGILVGGTPAGAQEEQPVEPIFQADFNGPGSGTGGNNDIVTFGGTGMLTTSGDGVAEVMSSYPDMGGGRFLRTQTPNGGTTAKVTFTPASPENSLASLWSKPDSQALLNGAVDFFFRSAEGVTDSTATAAFRPLDTSNTASGGLRLILYSNGGNTIRLQVIPGGGKQAAFTMQPDMVYHLGFTFSTDAGTGLTTAKMFAQEGNGAINTAGTPLFTFTFNMDESQVTQGFTGGKFDFGMFYPTQSASRTQDFDCFRVWNQVPAQLPANYDEEADNAISNVQLSHEIPNNVKISWENSNSSLYTSILRKKTGEREFTEAALLEGDVTEYLDQNLGTGATYYYMLRSFDESSNKYSAPTAEYSVDIPQYPVTVLEFVEPSLTLDVPGQEVEIKAGLKDQNGDPLSGKPIEFAIKNPYADFDTEIMTAVTDEDGIAGVTYTPEYKGQFQITANFAFDVDELLEGSTADMTLMVNSPEVIIEPGPPAVIRVTDAVSPGELVTIYGEDIMPEGIEAAVDNIDEQQPTESSTMLDIVQTDPDGNFAVAKLPESMEAGAYNLWVKNTLGWSSPIVLNAARPQWISTDQIAAGLKMKVVGRNLDGLEFGASRDTLVKLVSGANEYKAEILDVNPFAVEFTVSETVPYGPYDVMVSNDGGEVWRGLECDQQLNVVEKGDDPLGLGVSWAKEFKWGNTFNIKDYGAVGDGNIDDTAAIQAAVDAAKADGGGVVYMPNGRYNATSIMLPADVVLQGENRESTVLVLANSSPDVTGTYLIGAKDDGKTEGRIGVANFSMELDDNPAQQYPDHFIWLGHDWNDSLYTKTRTAEKIFVKDISLDYPLEERQGRGRGVIVLANKYILINGLDLKGYNANIESRCSNYIEVSDNKTFAVEYGPITALYQYALLERNHIEYTPYAAGENRQSRGTDAKGFAYVADNYLKNIATEANFGEIILTESWEAQTKMYGSIVSASVNTATVEPEIDEGGVLKGYLVDSALWQDGWGLELGRYPWRWHIVIIDGRGLGQYRELVSLEDTTYTIDRPWDVVPDSTSKFVIMQPTRDVTVYRNTAENSSRSILFYINGLDHVAADNHLKNTEGVTMTSYWVDSTTKDTRCTVQYFGRMERNIVDGPGVYNAVGGIGVSFSRESPEAIAWHIYGIDIKSNSIRNVGKSPYGPEYPYVGASGQTGINGLFVTNRVKGGTDPNRNAMKGIVVEDNIVKDSDRGLTLGSKGAVDHPEWQRGPMDYGTVVKDNMFMDVDQPIVSDNDEALKLINNIEIEDYTPPTTTINLRGDGQDLIFIGNASIELGAEDDIAGVERTEYSMDGGTTWKTYEVPVVISNEGTHEVQYRSIDRVGNIEQTKSVEFSLYRIPDIPYIRSLINQYEESQELQHPMGKQLYNSLGQAEHHLNKGHMDQAVKHMGEFIKHLNNETMSEKVTEEAKAVLNIIAEAIIREWEE